MNDVTTLTSIIENKIIMVYEYVASWLDSASVLYQLLIILGVFAVAYGLARVARHLISSLQEPEAHIRKYSRSWFIRRSGRLIYPVFAIALLFVAESVSSELFKNTDVINAGQRLAFIFLLWVGLQVFVESALIRTAGIWIFVPAAILHTFGWLKPVADHLDNYGFSFGEVELTAYTFVKAVFYVSIIIWLGGVLSSATERYIRRHTNVARSTKELLIKVFDIGLYTVLFIITLNLIGIDLTVLAVFGGAVGVGLGFGLQKIASNFISGIILLTERSININNLVEMDDGIFGYVRKLGARASTIETFDGKEVLVPNEDFITSRVSNLTHTTNSGRIDVSVGVAYDTDLEKAYELILAAANDYDAASQKEGMQPACFLREFGDSSVNFLLTFWIEDVTVGRWGAQSDVMMRLWKSLKEHGIEIPFPQRDLHIRSGLEEVSNTPKKQSA